MDRPPICTDPSKVAMAGRSNYTSMAGHGGPASGFPNGYGNQASMMAQPPHQQQFYLPADYYNGNSHSNYRGFFETPGGERPIPTDSTGLGMALYGGQNNFPQHAQASPYTPMRQPLSDGSAQFIGYGIRPNDPFNSPQPPGFGMQSPFHMGQQSHNAAFNYGYHHATPNYRVSYQLPQNIPATFNPPRYPPQSPRPGQPTQGAGPYSIHSQQRSEASSISSLGMMSQHIPAQSLKPQVPAVSANIQPIGHPQLDSNFDMDRIIQDAANEAVRQMSSAKANEQEATVQSVASPSESSPRTTMAVLIRETTYEVVDPQVTREQQGAVHKRPKDPQESKQQNSTVEDINADASEEEAQEEAQDPSNASQQNLLAENFETSANIQLPEQKRKGAGRPTLMEELDRARKNPEATATKIEKKKKELEELKKLEADDPDKIAKDVKKKEKEIAKLEDFQRQVQEEQASGANGTVPNIAADGNPRASHNVPPAGQGPCGSGVKAKQAKTSDAKKKAAVEIPAEDEKEESDENLDPEVRQATTKRPGRQMAVNGWGENFKGKKRSVPGSKPKQHPAKRRKVPRTNENPDLDSSDSDWSIPAQEDEAPHESRFHPINRGDMDVDMDPFTDIDQDDIYSADKSSSYPTLYIGFQGKLDRDLNDFLRGSRENLTAVIDAFGGGTVPAFRDELIHEFGEDHCRAFQIQEIATRKMYAGSRVTKIPRQFSHVLMCSQSSQVTYGVRYIGKKRRQRIMRIKQMPDGTLGHLQLLGIMRFASDALRQEKGCLFVASRHPADKDLPTMQGILVAILSFINPVDEHRNTTHILDTWRAGPYGRPGVPLNPSTALLDEIDAFIKDTRKKEKKVNKYLKAADDYHSILKSVANAKRRRILYEKGELDIQPWEFEIFFPPYPPTEYLHGPPIQLDGLPLTLDDLPTDTRDIKHPLTIIERIQQEIDALPPPAKISHFWSDEYSISRKLVGKKLREAEENCFEEATLSPLWNGDVFMGAPATPFEAAALAFEVIPSLIPAPLRSGDVPMGDTSELFQEVVKTAMRRAPDQVSKNNKDLGSCTHPPGPAKMDDYIATTRVWPAC